MSATPEQILEWAEAYQGHDNAEGRGDNENCKWCGAWSDDDWRKPCPKSPRLMVASLIRAQAERVRVLEGALEAIKSDAAHVIDFYNRNGPTWTGKDGHEYDDMSSVLGRAETVIQQIDAALRGEA